MEGKFNFWTVKIDNQAIFRPHLPNLPSANTSLRPEPGHQRQLAVQQMDFDGCTAGAQGAAGVQTGDLLQVAAW